VTSLEVPRNSGVSRLESPYRRPVRAGTNRYIESVLPPLLPPPDVSRVTRFTVSSPTSSDLYGRRRILVADEDPTVVAFIIKTLRDNGHAVFHAYDGLSATELAFAMVRVDLVISNTKVNGLPGVELIHLLRERLPHLPIMYLANIERSTPDIESRLPSDVPILREPFTADELLALVGLLLNTKGNGVVPDVRVPLSAGNQAPGEVL
jgi:CheY-like chemotaxis protein